MEKNLNEKWLAKSRIILINSFEQKIDLKKVLRQSLRNQQETWLTSIKSILPFWIQNIIIIKNEIIIYTAVKHLNALISFLYYHTNTLFKTVPDITAIDYPDQKLRFEVVYLLLSPFYSNRIRIKN